MDMGHSPYHGQFMRFPGLFKFGQKAITSEKPEELGIQVTKEMTDRKKKMQEDPDAAGEDFVNEDLTPEEKTKDLKTNLKKVATKSGITDVPESATVDQLNTAIAGAKLAAAISGNYVNPNTGEAIRPTAGARIGQAVAEGLAVKRDTAEKRETAQQAMNLQRLKNAGKSTTAAKLPKNFETLLDIFAKKSETQAINETAKEFNEYFNDDTGTKLMNYLRGGQPTSGTPDPAPAEVNLDNQRLMVEYALTQKPKDRKAILEEAQKNGVDIEGL
jgi:hypothetical protein